MISSGDTKAIQLYGTWELFCNLFPVEVCFKNFGNLKVYHLFEMFLYKEFVYIQHEKENLVH